MGGGWYNAHLSAKLGWVTLPSGQPQNTLETPSHYIEPHHIISGERNRKEKGKILNSYPNDTNQYKLNFLFIFPKHTLLIILFDPPLHLIQNRSLANKNSSGSKTSSSVLVSQSPSPQLPSLRSRWLGFYSSRNTFPHNRTFDGRNIRQIYKV